MREAQHKEGPLGGFLGGVALLSGAIYLLFANARVLFDKPLISWVIGICFIMGLWMTVSNGLKLYAVKVRKLDDADADAWVGGAIGEGIVGTIKWAGIAGCAYAAYNFIEGPFATLDLGTKTIAVLLAANAALLLGVLYNTDKIINRMKR